MLTMMTMMVVVVVVVAMAMCKHVQAQMHTPGNATHLTPQAEQVGVEAV